MAKTAYNILEEKFTSKITVLNIAVPTACLEPDSAKGECLRKNYNVHLVKALNDEDIKVYCRDTNNIRPLCDSEVISESTPILDVIEILCSKEQVFVKVKRNITHLVTRSDLDTIPVRIWLYGMISLFEVELKAKIIRELINWEDLLPSARLEKAKELYLLKKSKNEEINMLGCTQLVDLGTIIFKSWEHFQTFFPSDLSKNTIRSSFSEINFLRDTLAHGQKLQQEWPEIHDLIQLISFSLRTV